MYKMLIISLGLLLSSVSHAQYFYYWVDEYEANRTADNSVYINTHFKSLDLNSFTFTVNDYVIAKDIEILKVLSFSNSVLVGFIDSSLCNLCSSLIINSFIYLFLSI